MKLSKENLENIKFAAEKCSDCMKYKDMGGYDHHKNYFNKMLRLLSPEDKTVAQKVFNDTYKSFAPKPTYFN